MPKQIVQAAFLLLSLVAAAPAQTKAKPSPITTAEKSEAAALAADFVTALELSLDVDPVIDRFFISDFDKRNKFCRTVHKCGGFARAFWGVDYQIAQLNPTDSDFRRQYVNVINYFFLYSQSVKYLAPPKDDNSSTENAEATVNNLISTALKDDPDSLKLNIFAGETDSSLERPKTLAGFRKELADYERLVYALKRITLDLRSKKGVHSRYSSKDFRIDLDDDSTPFFDYPEGTRIFEVWPNDFIRLPFKMDLVRQGRALKIVAIYPPID